MALGEENRGPIPTLHDRHQNGSKLWNNPIGDHARPLIHVIIRTIPPRRGIFVKTCLSPRQKIGEGELRLHAVAPISEARCIGKNWPDDQTPNQ